jgi:aminopeptidase S
MARLDSYLNLDMVGSPNPARFVYDEAGAAPGSAQITQELLDALAGAGSAGLTTDPGGASDHYAFTLAGIPTGGVFSGLAPLTAQQAEVFGGQPGMPADPCYHLACDTRTNVNTASAVVLGQAAANVLVERAY